MQKAQAGRGARASWSRGVTAAEAGATGACGKIGGLGLCRSRASARTAARAARRSQGRPRVARRGVVTASGAAHRGAAACACARSCRTAHRRSSSVQGNRNAPERTHEDDDGAHGVEVVASSPLQPGPAPRVEMDALRKLRRAGGAPDTAAAARRCSGDRHRSSDSSAPRCDRSRAVASPRTRRRSTGCPGRIGCRRRPRPCNRRT